ncbi:MAG: hypothetical protein FD189_1131 [Elusimicrobia bacterium]|nr:MAG: hypothetical protein FD154_1575 [Elusimicrobiota bacterium]KAF0156180.1 MAG: hypothetical protein FD189_1131 [Elusimicrobiota bacterium]
MKTRILAAAFLSVSLSGCFGGMKTLQVVDYTDARVTDLTLTKKVVGKREFIFFSTTKTGVFLEGNIQGSITDYQGNPIEGVTVRAVAETGRRQGADEGGFGGGDLLGIEETATSFVTLSFTPGITDTLGVFKIRFSLPVVDDEVDVRGRLIYNPGWDQQRLNLGKAYEPQLKESPFRLFYNLDSGFLAFAEGVRKIIVQPIGEGKGRMDNLPGARAPAQPAPAAQPAAAPAGAADDDLFKAFGFGE